MAAFAGDEMRLAHRNIVCAFVSARPNDARGWSVIDDEATAQYVCNEIKHHVQSALANDRLQDSVAISWLDSIPRDAIAKAACSMLTTGELDLLAKEAEARGDLKQLSIRYLHNVQDSMDKEDYERAFGEALRVFRTYRSCLNQYPGGVDAAMNQPDLIILASALMETVMGALFRGGKFSKEMSDDLMPFFTTVSGTDLMMKMRPLFAAFNPMMELVELTLPHEEKVDIKKVQEAVSNCGAGVVVNAVEFSRVLHDNKSSRLTKTECAVAMCMIGACVFDHVLVSAGSYRREIFSPKDAVLGQVSYSYDRIHATETREKGFDLYCLFGGCAPALSFGDFDSYCQMWPIYINNYERMMQEPDRDAELFNFMVGARTALFWEAQFGVVASGEEIHTYL
eukprot:SAG31_NODE_9368_length_1289_cov_1.475630_1_plen_395_part_01